MLDFKDGDVLVIGSGARNEFQILKHTMRNIWSQLYENEEQQVLLLCPFNYV